MELAELLYGSTGKIVSSICIMVILILMFMITVHLYMSRRKKAYFSLALSLVLIIVQHLIIIILGISRHDTTATQYFIEWLKVLAFIWINIGIYQLYNPTHRAVKVITYTTTFIVFILAFMHFLDPAMGEKSMPWIRFVGSHLMLEICLLALILFSAFFIRPFIGQTGLYTLSLGLFTLAHVIQMVSSHLLSDSHPAWNTIVYYMPVIYYGILFFIVFRRIIELLQAVFESSIMDGLTGVYNRAYIMSYAQKLVRRRQASVIFSDIDNFKRLNDTQGHQMGDEVLKAVARIMSETVEGIGKAGRYGGEEIVAVLYCNANEVKKTAERIRQRVEAETPVTISVGYSIYRDGVSVHELMKQADEAMYISKKTGKNKVTPYSGKVPKLLASLNAGQ